MKRLATTLLLVIALLLVSVPLGAGSANAQTQKQADKCRQDWKGDAGKFFSDADSQKRLEKYNESGCDESQGGNCSTTSEGSGSFTYLQVKCGKKPGVFPGDTGADVPDVAGAGDPAVNFATSECGKEACNIIANYINPAIMLLTICVGIAVVLGIIVGAIQVTTSAGDPQKAASGKDHIRNALIAAVAYLLLFGMLSWLIPGGIA